MWFVGRRGDGEAKKTAQVLQLHSAFSSSALAAPCLPLPVSPAVRLHVPEVGKRRLWGE